jgi:hypothetical protein
VLATLLQDGHFYALETGKSEDLAAFAHFFMTVTPFGQSKRDWQKDIGGQVSKTPEAKPTSDPKPSDGKSVSGAEEKSSKKPKTPTNEAVVPDDKSAKSKPNKK